MGGRADSILYNLVGWVLLLPHFTNGETEAQGGEVISCVGRPTDGARLCGSEAGSISVGAVPREASEAGSAVDAPAPCGDPARRDSLGSGPT